MNKKTVIIVDDEAASRLLVRQYLKDFREQFTIIGECCNGIEAIRDIDMLQPDLVFLDIQMPGKNGFQVLAEVTVVPGIIFLTAYDQYAIRAFELNAVDYLLKPFNKERFEMAIARITTSEAIPNLSGLSLLASVPESYIERIFVYSGPKLINLKVDDIVYVKAEREYCKIYTETHSYLSSYGIGNIEPRLNPFNFVRVHRSYIINMKFVSELYKEIYKTFVVMSTGIEISIGRSYLPRIKKFIF